MKLYVEFYASYTPKPNMGISTPLFKITFCILNLN